MTQLSFEPRTFRLRDRRTIKATIKNFKMGNISIDTSTFFYESSTIDFAELTATDHTHSGHVIGVGFTIELWLQYSKMKRVDVGPMCIGYKPIRCNWLKFTTKLKRVHNHLCNSDPRESVIGVQH